MVSFSDTTAFNYRMLGALTNPTYYGNLDLAWENVDLSSALAAGWVQNPSAGVPAINPPLIEFAPSSSAYDFGLMLGSTMFTPGMYTDSIHWNFDAGLFNPFSAPSNQAYIEAMLNNVHWDFSLSNFGSLNLGNIGNFYLGGGNGNLGVVVADDASKIDKSDKAKFERKARLLEKISEDYKQQITEIRVEIKGDYKKGIEKLDELLKAADKSDVQKAVVDLYKEDRKSRLGKAKEISRDWAYKITNENKFKVDVSLINSDNILDVLGTFITTKNTDKDTDKEYYQNESTWRSLIEKNEKVVDTLLEKAKAMEGKVNNDVWTYEIEPRIKAVEKDKTKHNIVFGLFNTVRANQARLNDKDVAARYGATSEVTIQTNIAYDAYIKELDTYNSTLYGKFKANA